MAAPTSSEDKTLKDFETLATSPRLFCKVCGGQAGKHNYYGARTCISCRGFFRRSVQSRQYQMFCCSRGFEADVVTSIRSAAFSCSLDSKSRKSCKKCRFEKCIAIGMRIAWVLSDDERCHRMLQRSRSAVSWSATAIMPLQLHFTREEKEHAEMLYNVSMDIFHQLYFEMYASDVLLMRSAFHHSIDGRPFSYEEVKFFEAMDEHAITEVLFKMFRIHNIPHLRDAHVLAKHNVSRLVALYQSLVCKQGDMDSYMGDFLTYGVAHRDQSSSVDLVLKEMEAMRIGEKNLIYNYEIMHSSPWAPHIDFEQRHRIITETINNWLRSEEDASFDKIQLIILTMVLMYCTDGLKKEELANPEIIEETQQKYLMMLHRYLRDKYPQRVHNKLANGVMIIHNAKEAHDLSSNRLPI